MPIDARRAQNRQASLAASARRIREEEYRASIDAEGLIRVLSAHALGTEDMTDTRVRAALGLLKKVLPDVTEGSMEVSGEVRLVKVRTGIVRS